VAKPKRKAKPGRKPTRVKIKGNPLPLIDHMLGKGSSSTTDRSDRHKTP
jgi:hypothetical protein